MPLLPLNLINTQFILHELVSVTPAVCRSICTSFDFLLQLSGICYYLSEFS